MENQDVETKKSEHDWGDSAIGLATLQQKDYRQMNSVIVSTHRLLQLHYLDKSSSQMPNPEIHNKLRKFYLTIKLFCNLTN